MKKEIFLIVIGIVSIAAAYLLPGVVCDMITASSTPNRIIPIYNVETDKKCVALTFDAAWGNEDTDEIIDILEKYDAAATFFVTGQWAKKFPEDVKKLHEAGHDIGNHSDQHPHIDNMSEDELKADTDKCNERIENIIGKKPLLYRGPYGEYNNTLIEMLHCNKMYYIQWDVDSLDWKNPTPEQIVKNVVSKADNGSIILLHTGAENTPAALPQLLQALKDDGYEFVLVRDMIYTEDYTIDHTGKQIRNVQ